MREAMFNRLRQFNPSRIFESCGGRAELIFEPLHIRQWLVGQWDTRHSLGLCRTSGTVRHCHIEFFACCCFMESADHLQIIVLPHETRTSFLSFTLQKDAR
jgi:hypothetical protein